jgi:hypothetical protein
MTTRGVTGVIILAVIAGLVGWDVWAMLHAGPSATISDVVLGTSRQYLAIPFAAGFLCGHLFAAQRAA